MQCVDELGTLVMVSSRSKVSCPVDPSAAAKNCNCGGGGSYSDLWCSLCKECCCENPPTEGDMCDFCLCNPCLLSESISHFGKTGFRPNKDCLHSICFRPAQVPTFHETRNKRPVDQCCFCGENASQRARWCNTNVCQNCLAEKRGPKPRADCIVCNRKSCCDYYELHQQQTLTALGQPNPDGYWICPKHEYPLGFQTSVLARYSSAHSQGTDNRGWMNCHACEQTHEIALMFQNHCGAVLCDMCLYSLSITANGFAVCVHPEHNTGRDGIEDDAPSCFYPLKASTFGDHLYHNETTMCDRCHKCPAQQKTRWCQTPVCVDCILEISDRRP